MYRQRIFNTYTLVFLFVSVYLYLSLYFCKVYFNLLILTVKCCLYFCSCKNCCISASLKKSITIEMEIVRYRRNFGHSLFPVWHPCKSRKANNIEAGRIYFYFVRQHIRSPLFGLIYWCHTGIFFQTERHISYTLL